MRSYLFLFIFSLAPFFTHAEPSLNRSTLQLNAYFESYYVDARESRRQLPEQVYSYQQVNQPAINLAYVQASFAQPDIRGNLAFAGGTFMRANYAREPEGLDNLYQANVGIRLSEQQQIWLDVGVMPSHIGLETARGLDNWTLTRSMMADNSPYYETGLKLSYRSPDQRLTVAGLLLNGWQRIRRQSGNSLPALGHLISYQINEDFTINSSSFIGSDTPDRERRMRYFHHLDMQYNFSPQWQMQAAWDIGAQQPEKASSEYHVWHSPLLQVRYKIDAQMAITGRWEAFYDPHQVIIQVQPWQRFSTQAISLNFDYALNAHMAYRVELKYLDSDAAIFRNHQQTYQQDLLINSALILHY